MFLLSLWFSLLFCFVFFVLCVCFLFRESTGDEMVVVRFFFFFLFSPSDLFYDS